MSQTLVVELSDDVYASIQRQAMEAHTSPAQVVVASLEQHFSPGQRMQRESHRQNEAELQAARERFERHIGAVDLGYETGADNESIDADLAREYAHSSEA